MSKPKAKRKMPKILPPKMLLEVSETGAPGTFRVFADVECGFERETLLGPLEKSKRAAILAWNRQQTGAETK